MMDKPVTSRWVLLTEASSIGGSHNQMSWEFWTLSSQPIVREGRGDGGERKAGVKAARLLFDLMGNCPFSCKENRK